jgi:hypothetical protein
VLVQTTANAELNLAFNLSKQGVVTPHSDIVAGVESSTALTNNDSARLNHFRAENLNAKSLGI